MKKSYPFSLKKMGLTLGLLFVLSLGIIAQPSIHVELWKNVTGSGGTVNNYPVWIKLGAPLNYTISGVTDNSGRYTDSIPNITVATPATFITYSCTGARIVSQQTLAPNRTSYGDTLVVTCSNPAPAINAYLYGSPNVINPMQYSFVGAKSDTALPSSDIRYNYILDYGDGQSTNGIIYFPGTVNRTHNYASIGGYTTCFTVTAYDSITDIELFTATDCNTINVVAPSPSCSANFTSSSSGAGLFNFSDASTVGNPPTGGSTSYGWNFGDGNGASTQSANHTYQSNGFYTVCHWVVLRDTQNNVVCTDTVCKQINNISSPVSCNANFSYLTSGSGVYNFIDGSTVGSPTSYRVSHYWDFGDGSSDTNASVNHTYLSTGTYQVCHTIVAYTSGSQNVICSDTVCKQVNYGTSPTNCFADFMYSGTSSGTFTFMDSSSVSSVPAGGSVSYGWDFGNGFGANTQSATHTYQAPGAYNVCHWVVVRNAQSNIVCTDTICKSVVYVGSGGPSCNLDLLVIIDTTVGQYNFGAGVAISAIYDSSYFYLDFGDGNDTSLSNIIPSIPYTYQSSGTFIACATMIWFDQGNQVCTSTDCDTINVQLPISPFCNAQYIVDTANSYQGNVFIWNTSTPSNNSSIHVNSYQWNFGDGNTSTQPFPTHTYTSPGVYGVCLTITSTDSANNICTDTYCDTLGVDSLGNLIYKTTSGFTLNVLDPNAIGLGERIVEEFAVYPNPATNVVTVAWNNVVNGEMEWQITDLKGVMLMKGVEDASNKKEMQLDVSRLKAGVYILSASHKNNPVAHYKLRIN